MVDPMSTPQSDEFTLIESGDGTPIALHSFGGTGPRLFVCHATGFHARNYLPLIARFTQSFEVFGIDVRGHGQSQLEPTDTFTWRDFAQDLLAAIDHLGGEPVRAFGHSMGGTTILLADHARPGIIERAWMYEPIVFPADLAPRNSMMSEAAGKRRSIFPSKADALWRYASRPPLNVFRADALAAYVDGGFLDTDDGQVRLACRPHHEAMTYNGAGTPASEVAQFAAPIVVARGAFQDGPSPAEFAIALHDALGDNSTMQAYDDLVHVGPFQDPARIAHDAATFLVTDD